MIIDTIYIVAIGDIASIFDVVPSAISNWKRRFPDFPEPIFYVANGNTPLFDRREIMKWYQEKISD